MAAIKNRLNVGYFPFSKGPLNGRLEIKEANVPVFVGVHNLYTPVFKDENVCISLVEDVRTLHSWLEQNGYIKGAVATEKFTLIKNLHF